MTPTNDVETLSCPLPWVELLRSLACASPVCALVRPNQEVFTLLKDVATDPEKARHCSATMASLQKEIPVLFTLISSQPTTSSRILSSIVDELVRKSNAPFVTDSFNETSSLKREHVESKSSFKYSYFPSLPPLRSRNVYSADKQCKQNVVCTKNSSGHPTLLPGIFTLYCPHGKRASLTAVVKPEGTHM